MKKEILVFSDSMSTYGKYRSLLEGSVISMSHRATWDEALEYINARAVDILIVDLDIPKMEPKHFVNEKRRKSPRARIH